MLAEIIELTEKHCSIKLENKDILKLPIENTLIYQTLVEIYQEKLFFEFDEKNQKIDQLVFGSEELNQDFTIK
ncbi:MULTISPECIES: hypothetical protein [unclassified Aerococcus]|uniref:hypothetical protein n=1 Tax=unclassified Aerococcus TaxID=2618060 RepID=UPI0008A1D08C|nr:MULTISPECIES: hypothetical protein [unclassified Aerococcus]MDK6679203.1 hypothetical protein [Aerococcus sp. UMB8608]MDK6685955.1 hypothetical protein [Aerococcus sp. UMB8623]MDK6940760.1 hypothetical protein [Aerococcus sp. UMB8487]OFK21268.1 hypothetical protein HMPREF2829_03755 [Aerococcus sp. HMSC072A12]OFR32576.1 hypothetical protein HMPREF2892_08160 [Aerococcus sp. HMSC061A03]